MANKKIVGKLRMTPKLLNAIPLTPQKRSDIITVTAMISTGITVDKLPTASPYITFVDEDWFAFFARSWTVLKDLLV